MGSFLGLFFVRFFEGGFLFVWVFFSEKGRTYGMMQEDNKNRRLGCNTLLHPLLMAEKVMQSSSKPVQIYSCIFISPD